MKVIAAGHATGRVDEHGLFDARVSHPREHDASRGALIEIHDPIPVFRPSQDDAAGTHRPLEVPVRPGRRTCLRRNQNPARPCGLLYGIATLVTSLSEPSGWVA